MGKTAAAGRSSKTQGKKPAFQLSKAPLTHGHASPPPGSQPALPLKNSSRTRRSTEQPPSAASADYEDLGPLPTTYGSQSLFLIARDPEWLFCYWDIDWENRPGAPGSGAVLKLFHATPANAGSSALEAFSTGITADARDWYIPVRQIGQIAPPDAPQGDQGGHGGEAPRSLPTTLYAEIGYLAPDGTWDVIARSYETTVPAHGLSSTLHEEFATIPFHLAFERMQQMIEKTRRKGEPLATALARIQTEGHHLIVALGKAPSWTTEQRHLLAALLGNELSQLLAMSVEEIDALLREQLKEHLASAEAALAARATAGNAEALAASGGLSSLSAPASLSSLSSLSSQSALSWGALEGLSSLSTSIDHAFWSSWLSSWKEGARSSFSLSQEAVALSGLSSESALSSALSSWISSWPGGELETESSLPSSFLSSWPTAVGAGESAFWSSWLSSWSQAAGVAGVAGGESSGALSSFGLSSFGASWGVHPGGAGRDFFMHVNAEVIFYGGTHPEATLWVDGKQVPLKPDGSFHFHYKLPDGDTTVPIVARSPDGVEQRSVALRFTRDSHRSGNVGHTRQPEHLPTLGH